MIVGLGGAAAVVMTSGRSSGLASSALAIVLRTVGAPLRWVICSPCSSSQIRSARTARRQTWRAPTAVTPQVVHQPLQWNIGSVHR